MKTYEEVIEVYGQKYQDYCYEGRCGSEAVQISLVAFIYDKGYSEVESDLKQKAFPRFFKHDKNTSN
jgi:hypothetical protein